MFVRSVSRKLGTFACAAALAASSFGLVACGGAPEAPREEQKVESRSAGDAAAPFGQAPSQATGSVDASEVLAGMVEANGSFTGRMTGHMSFDVMSTGGDASGFGTTVDLEFDCVDDNAFGHMDVGIGGVGGDTGVAGVVDDLSAKEDVYVEKVDDGRSRMYVGVRGLPGVGDSWVVSDVDTSSSLAGVSSDVVSRLSEDDIAVTETADGYLVSVEGDGAKAFVSSMSQAVPNDGSTDADAMASLFDSYSVRFEIGVGRDYAVRSMTMDMVPRDDAAAGDGGFLMESHYEMSFDTSHEVSVEDVRVPDEVRSAAVDYSDASGAVGSDVA